MRDPLTTYLQDHHAGSAAGVDLFRRVAADHGDADVRDAVRRIGAEVREDQKALESIMAAVGSKPSLVKDGAARVGEKVARMKPNERLTKRSPLSDVMELEMLVIAVHGKSLGWALLLALDDPRIDRARVLDLHERAKEQLDELEALRITQVSKLD